jgi:hypothetical protein
MPRPPRPARVLLRRLVPLLIAAAVQLAVVRPAPAQDDARTKQLRLLCAQLSGDLTEPGGIAAFKRCLTQDPGAAMKQNLFPGSVAPVILPPAGFGRNARRLIAAAVVRFQALGADTVYVLTTDGKLWRGTIGASGGKQIESSVAEFQAVDDGHLYVQSGDGHLWLAGSDPNKRQPLAEDVAAFQAMPSGAIYVLGRDRQLWRNAADHSGRALVDAAVVSFQAIDDSIVGVLGSDGKLWREVGTQAHCDLIASSIASFREIGDTLYVLVATDHSLWRKTANDKAVRVDGPVELFQPADTNLVYVLGKDGNLWRELGDNTQRQLVDNGVALQPGAFQAMAPAKVLVLGADHRLWLETMPPGR